MTLDALPPTFHFKEARQHFKSGSACKTFIDKATAAEAIHKHATGTYQKVHLALSPTIQ